MHISSIIDSITSFNRYNCIKMCRDACFDALPILPALRAVLELGLINHPQFARNENLLDPEGENFLLDGSRERTEKVVDLYLQRRVRVAAPTGELKDSAMTGIKMAFIDACQRRMVQIDKIAADFGIKKVSFGISVPHDPSVEEAPYEAVGVRASRFSNPMIVCNPPCLNVQVDSTLQVSGEQPIDERDKEFVIAHEMVHIAKNHELIATVSYLAYSVLVTGIWAAGLSGGITLASTLCTYGVVVGAAALPFELFFYSLRRSQEQEADVEAIRYLKTNEGAKQYLEGFKKRGMVDDLEHPPFDRRIAYIQAAV